MCDLGLPCGKPDCPFMAAANSAVSEKSNPLLCRAAGWLSAPEGESKESTVALIRDLVAEIKRLQGTAAEAASPWAVSLRGRLTAALRIARVQATDFDGGSRGQGRLAALQMQEHCVREIADTLGYAREKFARDCGVTTPRGLKESS